jgi:hypothetical protein
MRTAQAAVTGTQADVRGTLAAVQFATSMALPFCCIAGTWTQHTQYGWQVQVRTAELTDRVDRRGTVALRVACTRHPGPVRAC